MKDIFLSFQTDDDHLARQTSEFLEQQGWSCWRCTSNADNTPGNPWVPALVEALLAAPVMTVLYTRNAVRSSHVFREISMAVGADKAVVVVCLDDTPFPPEWIYLVRTEQMLNAQRQQPAEWLPALAQSLRKLLPSHFVSPVDSIPDRRIKVRFCRELHRELFGESLARLIGATVRFPGIVRAHLVSPQHTIQRMRAVDHALAILTEVKTAPSPVACVPFRGSEDTFFVVWLVAADAEEERATRIARNLPRMILDALSVRSGHSEAAPAPEFQIYSLPPMTWHPRDGDEILAAFFADPGVEIAALDTSPEESQPTRGILDEKTRRLLSKVQLASVGTNASHLSLRLPIAMTVAAAENRLHAILTER